MSVKTVSTTNLMDNVKFKEFIDAFLALTQGSENLSLPQIRERCTRFFLPENTVYEPVKQIENIEIERNNDANIPVRLFIPDSEKQTLPVVIYLHRGGWVFGSIEEADPVCRKLANHWGCIVASVGYRHAPENPFPKPLEDCYEATQWIAKNITRFGGDSNEVMICGESVGGNLATVVAMMCRDKGGVKLSKQILICPVISSSINEASYKASADKYFITLDSMKFFWSMYLQSPEDYSNRYASPEKAIDLSELPPAVIITAEHDPLAVEAEDYANKLRSAGVQVSTKSISGVIHGFIDLPIYDEKQKIDWIKEMGLYL